MKIIGLLNLEEGIRKGLEKEIEKDVKGRCQSLLDYIREKGFAGLKKYLQEKRDLIYGF